MNRVDATLTVTARISGSASAVEQQGALHTTR
jgi:hypothetical protein